MNFYLSMSHFFTWQIYLREMWRLAGYLILLMCIGHLTGKSCLRNVHARQVLMKPFYTSSGMFILYAKCERIDRKVFEFPLMKLTIIYHRQASAFNCMPKASLLHGHIILLPAALIQLRPSSCTVSVTQLRPSSCTVSVDWI